MLLTALSLTLALAAPADTVPADSLACAGTSPGAVVVTIAAAPTDSAADERFCAWGLDARLATAPSAAPGAVVVTIAAAPTDSAADERFCAWGLDARLATAPSAAPGARAASGASRAPAGEVRFTRALDAAAAGASRLRVSGRRVASVTVDLPAAGGAPVRLQLTGVTVVAQHIVAAAGGDDPDAQLATQAADALQLEADRNEAARRLTELRALDQRKLAAGFEIARAEERVKVLDARLDVARRQMQRTRRAAARAGAAAEEVTLAAERAEVVEGGR